MTEKPLLLIDVDGPLNPYGLQRNPEKAASLGYEMHDIYVPSKGVTYPVLLNPKHGEQLQGFRDQYGFELVWATTWELHANELIGPKIGLDEIDTIIFESNYQTVRYWKFASVEVYAKGRPLAWLDDDFNVYPEAAEWFEEQRGGTPTALIDISASTGITSRHFEKVVQWAKENGVIQ